MMNHKEECLCNLTGKLNTWIRLLHCTQNDFSKRKFNKKAFLILTMTQNQLTRFFTWITCLSRGTFNLDEISLGLDEQTIISNSPEEWDVTIIIDKQFIN